MCLCLCFCPKEVGNQRGGDSPCFVLISWCYGLPSKHGSGFPCLLCSFFHLSMGCGWEGPSPAGFAGALLPLTSTQGSGLGWGWAVLLAGHEEQSDRSPGASLLYKGMGITSPALCSARWDSHDQDAVLFSSFAPCATNDSAASSRPLP